MTWYTLFDLAPSIDAGPGPGWTVRQHIPVSAYRTGAPSTGTQLRVTLRAGSNSLNTPRTFGGHAAVAGDLVDFDGTQVQFLFGGAAAASVATGGTLVSDGVTYSFDKTKPLVISAETSFPSVFLGGPDAAVFFTNISGATHAGDTDVTVASTETKFLWPKVEVFFVDPPGNPTVTVNKTSSQADPTSGGTVSFAVAFNKGVTGLTASDFNVAFSGSGTLVPTLVGQDFNFILSVTGMLTTGDIVVSLPAGRCFGALGEPNDASTSTDNSVHWDPDVIDPNLPNVYEVTTIDRNMLRIEVREPPNPLGHYEVLGSPDVGADTYPITGAVNNGYGQVRITTTTAGASIKGMGPANGGIYILNMTASPVSNGIGGQRIRCQIYDTTYFTAPANLRTTVDIRHARGTIEANCGENTVGNGAPWSVAVIDATHFDLVATVQTVPIPSAFVNAYTGGAVISDGNGGGCRMVVHSVGGTTEANGPWVGARSGLTTIDLADSYFTNAFTSDGRLIFPGNWVQRANPALGGALDFCFLSSRFGNVQKFQDPPLVPGNYLNRAAAIVAANYGLTGGLSVTNVFRKIQPYSMGYGTYGAINFSTPNCSFRHYYYLQLSGNLVPGTYTLTFPPGTGLPPKTFTFNDKVTRCSALTSDQNGHRAGDNGKILYLNQWVPDYGTYGDYAYPAVANWHLINSSGSIVFSAGAAPVLRTTATSFEGVSFDAPNHTKSPPMPIRQKGKSLKVMALTNASPGHATVDDGSTLVNGELIALSAMTHMAARGTGAPDVGIKAVESDAQGNPYYYRVANKSGNAFDLSIAKSVFSATIAAGGTGHVVGNIISLNNRVKLQVLTVGGGGAITSVTPVPNEVTDFGFALPNVNSLGSGWIDYPYTLPSNPQAQTGTTGSGSGATFNLTWADNPFDTTLLPGRGSFGNPNTSSMPAFATSFTGNQGNLCYRVNELANRGGTNIYGMDYSAAPLTPGTYYGYIPNIGVSDPIVIRESAWYEVATCYLKGLYHQRSGCSLDGRFGFTRDVGFKTRTGFTIHKSYLPYGFDRYSLHQTSPSIVSAGVPDGQGGGYDPWITITVQNAFGSHGDAGDWDCRIDEMGPFYWGILDVWQHLSAPVKASLSNQGTPTLLSCGLDPVVFAGTNGMPSAIAEVIYGIEMYRLGQEPSGGTIGGMNYGEGVPLPETSSTTMFSIYSWYPDHYVTLQYVFVAAKLAKVLSDLGYTSLAAVYQASAIAGYDWSLLMTTDAATRDAWYLPVKTRALWTTAQYNSAIASLENNVTSARSKAAAALFALTGGGTYKAVCDAAFPVGDPDGTAMFGQWEYANAAGATPAVRDAIHVQNLQFIERVILLYSDAPDVTYYSPSGAGRWPMNFGGGNNFQFSHHCIIGALTYASLISPAQPADAARCRKALQNWFGFRHGGNQLGLCMTKGLGFRNNRETLHIDSVATSQAVPLGLCSEGWGNLFPALPLALGTSNIDVVQHPQSDTELILDDATIPYREMYPYDQLAWPRWEFMMQIRGAIEHAEFTTQQQIAPAYSGALFLHGWDGNTDIGIGGATSTTVLTSSPNPSLSGNFVLLTATVSGGSGIATGIVSFMDGVSTIGTGAVNGAGVATFITSGLSIGSHSISAVYGGDSTYAGSTSNTITQVVNALVGVGRRKYTTFNV